MIGRVRILIVEDDATLASGIARILEGEGHAVDVVSRGEQAVLGARQERFDMIILDVGLPDGVMGNSEVGHENIGAGRIVDQELVRINKLFSEKRLAANPVCC